jgi:RimJ/RimL family protein N-acetyltransferase
MAPWGRGCGVATTATRVISSWTLREQGFERVEVRAATGNLASQRVAEKAGFVREGVARNAGHVHDGRVDLVVYSLTRADLGLVDAR